MRKPRESARLAPRSPLVRSRITNHKDILPGVDGRKALARRYRDILTAILSDQGGVERLAEGRIQLARRFAGASALAEKIEADLVLGKQVDVAAYATIVSTVVRVAQRIGIDRKARDVTPDLRDYIEAKASG